MSPSLKKINSRTPLLLSKLNKVCSEKRLSKSYSDKTEKTKKNFLFSNNSNKKEKIKILWSEGGEEILLTGSFCNWNRFYSMKKDDKNKYYYCILDLPKGFHQFKFKVDGKWKNSKIYPIISNDGNKNNYYDNSTNYDNLTNSTVESSAISTNINNKNNIILNNDKNSLIFNNKNKIDFPYSKKNYCFYYPNRNDMNQYPDKKPCHFPTETYLGVNQTQKIIGNKNYLILGNTDTFSGNYSYKDIERKEHIFLNHLCNRQINKISIINSSTIKYRHKNCTFLYYK